MPESLGSPSKGLQLSGSSNSHNNGSLLNLNLNPNNNNNTSGLNGLKGNSNSNTNITNNNNNGPSNNTIFNEVEFDDDQELFELHPDFSSEDDDDPVKKDLADYDKLVVETKAADAFLQQTQAVFLDEKAPNMDDFFRNFLVKNKLHKTLDTFQHEFCQLKEEQGTTVFFFKKCIFFSL